MFWSNSEHLSFWGEKKLPIYHCKCIFYVYPRNKKEKKEIMFDAFAFFFSKNKKKGFKVFSIYFR